MSRLSKTGIFVACSFGCLRTFCLFITPSTFPDNVSVFESTHAGNITGLIGSQRRWSVFLCADLQKSLEFCLSLIYPSLTFREMWLCFLQLQPSYVEFRHKLGKECVQPKDTYVGRQEFILRDLHFANRTAAISYTTFITENCTQIYKCIFSMPRKHWRSRHLYPWPSRIVLWFELHHSFLVNVTFLRIKLGHSERIHVVHFSDFSEGRKHINVSILCFSVDSWSQHQGRTVLQKRWTHSFSVLCLSEQCCYFFEAHATENDHKGSCQGQCLNKKQSG